MGSQINAPIAILIQRAGIVPGVSGTAARLHHSSTIRASTTWASTIRQARAGARKSGWRCFAG
jgi:hypothetical protein